MTRDLLPLFPRRCAVPGRWIAAALALCCLLAVPIRPGQCADPLAETKNLLVLHSYHNGFSWTDNEAQGIGEVLAESGLRLRVFTEYMDSKRYLGERWFERLRRLYTLKYESVRFDAVICTDDNAYRFLLAHQPELFPGCPVVFCGVNSYDPQDLEGRSLFTGLPEVVDIRATLEAARILHPGVDTVYVVVDRTPTGVSTRRVLRRTMPAFTGRLHFVFLDDLPMEKLLERVELVGKNGMVLLLNYNRDGLGRMYSHRETIDLLASHCRAPIYGQWDFHLGRGIMGGRLAAGREQGRMAAGMAVRILSGQDPADIPVDTAGSTTWMFDHLQLERFGIDAARLPEGSVLVNAPRSFYEVNKRLIWILAALVGLLVLALVGLSLHLMQRRRVEAALKRANQALVTLSQSNQHLILAGSEEDLVGDVCRVVVESGGYDLCWVGFASPPSRSITLHSRWDADAGDEGDAGWCRAEHGEQPVGRAFDSGTPCVADEDRPGAWSGGFARRARRRGYASILALPLKEGEAPFGVLCILSRRAGVFDEARIDLLSTLADNLAYGVVFQRASQERRNALKALRSSKDQMAVLLASLPIVPFACAGEDPLRITYVGEGVGEVAGHAASDFVQDPAFWHDRVHPEDLAEALAVFRSLKPGNTVQHRYRFRIADGSWRWFCDTRRMVGAQDEGGLRVTATWQDVTGDQRLRDEAEFRRRQVIQADKLASLGEVVAGVAHEINNPNSFIGYNVPLLRETWEIFKPIVGDYAARTPDWSNNGLGLVDYCEDMDGIVADIAEGASRISGVVASLKEFARGGGSGDPVPVAMGEVLRKAMVIVGAQVRRKFPDHVLDYAQGLPLVRGKPLELEQVATNLLVNATHAVGQGTGRLRARTRFVPRLGCVALEVEDTGCGMAPEVLRHAFEPFYTTRRENGGTGLGLSVSYLLVEEHGGLFCVLSRLGRGTRFCVLLPVEDAPRPVPRPSLACVTADASLAERLETELAGEGWAVVRVADAQALREILADRPEIFAVAMERESAPDVAGVLREHPLLAATTLDHGGSPADGPAALTTFLNGISQVIL